MSSSLIVTLGNNISLGQVKNTDPRSDPKDNWLTKLSPEELTSISFHNIRPLCHTSYYPVQFSLVDNTLIDESEKIALLKTSQHHETMKD